MCVGNETKPELDELLSSDAERVSYVEDARMYAIFRWIQARTPIWMGSNLLYSARSQRLPSRRHRPATQFIRTRRLTMPLWQGIGLSS
jgi:hypothetical protein